MADEAPETPAPEAAEAEKPVESSSNGKPTISVKVYAPFQVYFEGEANSVSAENATGPFDVLPRHHNFLCMLVPCNVTVQTATEKKVIKVSRALMHVKADRVVVFMDV